MVDKQATLDALAQGGTAARAAYEQSLAQINALRQQAITAALGDAAQKGIAPGAQQDISAIISDPYAQRAGTLQLQEANSQDYFNRLGAAANLYYDQTKNLIPAIEAEIAAKMAGGGGGGGSGGGGGGSGGGGGGGTEDWKKALKAAFGTTDKGQVALLARGAVKGVGDSSIPEFLRARQALTDQLGVPSDLGEYYVPTPKYYATVAKVLPEQLKNKLIGFGRIKRQTLEATKSAANPGAARTQRAYLLNQARAQGVTTTRQAKANRAAARAQWKRRHPGKPIPANLRG